MAAIVPYLILSPSSIMCLIGLLYGQDKIVPTPAEDWRQATVDVVIPAHNEIKNIIFSLTSLANQTLSPNNIWLVDDGSTDGTSAYAQLYAEAVGITNLRVIRKQINKGKTPILDYAAKESEADVLFVLDADTALSSENYIERLVEELYKGVGIACACGVVLPITDADRAQIIAAPKVKEFVSQYPAVVRSSSYTFSQDVQQRITNNYRNELYLFLQQYIYHGEMVFFGSIINPVGCAVAYRRLYLSTVLDHYHKILGHDLTTSEDIFLGFAFAHIGYRNIQVQGVYALTVEPRLFKLPKQIFLWSSAFLQSCYYFGDLVKTPFKLPRVLAKKLRDKLTGTEKAILEKRKIKEQYRQAFGVNYTKKYGRPIGWFIFTSLFEKISFPLIILLYIYLRWWEALLITITAEMLLFSTIIAFMHKNRRFINFFRSVMIAPVRYTFLLYDIIVISTFVKDLVSGRRNWRK